MVRNHHSAISSFLALSLLIPAAGVARAADTFIESDAYDEGESIQRVFLKDDDHLLMVEDIERNDTSFDRGWVLTPGFQDSGATPPDTRHKALRWLPRKSPQTLVQEPRELAFDLKSFQKIYIPPVANFAGIIKGDLLADIRGSFIEGINMFRLEVVESRDQAQRELGLATLDQMRDAANIPVYGIRIEPFILIELQLVDVATGQQLLLLRNRGHGQTVADAALNFADDFVKFLR